MSIVVVVIVVVCVCLCEFGLCLDWPRRIERKYLVFLSRFELDELSALFMSGHERLACALGLIIMVTVIIVVVQ